MNRILTCSLIVVSIFSAHSLRAESSLRPADLRCEYLENPLGIDRRAPSLSWKLQEASPAGRSLGQTAFQILVGTTEHALRTDNGDLWNSGKVVSDQSVNVVYAGKPLESRQRCWWKVRIWDQDGQVSGWSEPAMWSLGLLHADDWRAKWIGLDRGDETRPEDRARTRLPARMLRREFQARTQIKGATVYLSGLGFFDLYINGAKIGDHIMDPALTEYSKRILYVAFDVTGQLRPGKNALGVVLGNGRFFAPRSKKGPPAPFKAYGYPKLLLQLEIEYADGSRQQLVSDGDWKITTEGPIRANNEYDGEEYDARKEMPGWDKPGFDDSGWQKVELVQPPGGRLEAQMLEPTRITQVLAPVSISQTKPGVYLVDFGQNFYGQVRLRASAPAGAVVKMRQAYSLNPDGSLRSQDNRSALATDTYIFKGVGVEAWSPRFRGQGFRRVEVTGLPGKVTADQFEGLVVENSLDPVGTFECSIPLLNHIYRNMRWGQRMYLRNGVPLDPDRDERQGWLGDPAKDSEGEAFNFNVAAFYDKWLEDIRLDQQPEGKQSDVSPAYWAFYSGDIVWPSVLTIVPDWYYSFYGDRHILEVNYEAMKNWVDYCLRQLKPDYTLDKAQYADWCDTSSMDARHRDTGSTSKPLVGTAYCYLNAKLMARTAQRLGKAENEKQYTEVAAKIREGFNNRFLNRQTAKYGSETQTSYVLALAFGLVPEDLRPKVIQNLVDDIMVQHHGYLTVGLVGMQWLMETLTEIGHADAALTITTRSERPSWGYMISKGATTIWERWDMDTRDPGMNSEALLIQTGDLNTWFFQSLAGINYDAEHPGFKNIVMRPHLIPSLMYAKGSLDSPQGKVTSNWQLQNGKFQWDIVVPPNATATVYVPAKEQDAVTESGKPAGSSAGVKFLRMENGAAVYDIGSGSYSFASPAPKQ
jgi:alpha-L-rhamnosidase